MSTPTVEWRQAWPDAPGYWWSWRPGEEAHLSEWAEDNIIALRGFDPPKLWFVRQGIIRPAPPLVESPDDAPLSAAR